MLKVTDVGGANEGRRTYWRNAATGEVYQEFVDSGTGYALDRNHLYFAGGFFGHLGLGAAVGFKPTPLALATDERLGLDNIDDAASDMFTRALNKECGNPF